MSVPRATSAVRASRRLARRWLPRRLRAEALRLRRALRDRRGGIPFADGRGSHADFPYAFEGYRLPMLIYPGQERLAEGKRHNQRLMAEALDGARATASVKPPYSTASSTAATTNAPRLTVAAAWLPTIPLAIASILPSASAANNADSPTASPR